LVSSVIDTADHWSSATTGIFENKIFIMELLAHHRSEVSLTPQTTKLADFIVEYLGELEFTFEKALTRVSGAQMELVDEKKQRYEIS
jgi:hypothetical protein